VKGGIVSDPNPARPVEEKPSEPFEQNNSSRYPMAIWLSAGLSVLLLLGIGAASFGLGRKIDAVEDVISEVIGRANERRLHFQMSFLEELAAWNAYRLQPTQQTLRQIQQLHERTRQALAELSTDGARMGPEFGRNLDALRESLDLWGSAPVALMTGRLSLEELERLPRRDDLSIDVLAKSAPLGAGISRQREIYVANLRRLERRRVQILAGLYPLALFGIVLTAWFARRAMLSHQRLAESAAHAALVRDAMASLTGDEVLPTALRRIATNAMRIARVDGAFIEQSDDARREVEIVAAVGPGAPPEESHLPFAASITDDIVRAGETELSVDLTARDDWCGRLLGARGNVAWHSRFL
jgi:hypothetical protein